MCPPSHTKWRLILLVKFLMVLWLSRYMAPPPPPYDPYGGYPVPPVPMPAPAPVPAPSSYVPVQVIL